MFPAVPVATPVPPEVEITEAPPRNTGSLNTTADPFPPKERPIALPPTAVIDPFSVICAPEVLSIVTVPAAPPTPVTWAAPPEVLIPATETVPEAEMDTAPPD